MAKIRIEKISETVPGVGLASVECDEGETLSLADVGALVRGAGVRWANLVQACAFWERRQGESLDAAVVVAVCRDLPPGVSSVILGYPQTKRHGHSLVRHGDIARYHWPHDAESRKFLVALT